MIRILVVEDDEALNRSICMFLEPLYYSLSGLLPLLQLECFSQYC